MVDFAQTASEILDELWLGQATKPAQRLYPHQWSWDSAFIAIGNRHRRWDRARSELATLFGAQWANGMVPHIVFGPTESEYFPNARFWNSEATGIASRATSGICQPPVHALAVERVAEAAPADERVLFIGEMYEPLAAWHEYLHRNRAPEGPLVEIWHPWESGMDNSPAWDQPLQAMRFGGGDVPDYQRVDTALIDAADRPSDAEYDRYAYIVGRLRDEEYQPPSPQDLPFRVQDVLFNAALAASERVMERFAAAIGSDDGGIHRERAEAIEAALHTQLWDEDLGMYFSRDAVAGRLLKSTIAGGLLALLTPLPDQERLSRLMDTMHRHLLVTTGDGAVVRTSAPSEPGFDPIRYWRGPSWIQMNWLLAFGLDVNGDEANAMKIRLGVTELVERAGFFEYFDAPNLQGHGTDRFGWTAALYLDVTS